MQIAHVYANDGSDFQNTSKLEFQIIPYLLVSSLTKSKCIMQFQEQIIIITIETKAINNASRL